MGAEDSWDPSFLFSPFLREGGKARVWGGALEKGSGTHAVNRMDCQLMLFSEVSQQVPELGESRHQDPLVHWDWCRVSEDAKWVP